MSIYDDIFEASSSNSQMAGHLHELLWERLLQREDPRFHNIRLTKGDGGIDGLILKDPILGEVTVFQAKFYRNLSTLDYKSSIEASFIKAHSNELKIVEWCLLLPINLSHTELCWLLGGGLKKCAIRKLGTTKEKQINSCSITYRLESHLLELCARHLDIPSEILPKSSLALIKQLTEARDRADFLEKETVNYLRLINREQIRQRQIEAFSSLSSLKVLYQGWADHTGMLDLVRRRKGSVLQIEKAAKELELFSERRTSQAITAEAICPGISERITNIYQKSRLLVSTSIQLQISNDKDLTSSMWKIVDELVNDIRELQAISGTAILSSISKQKL